MELGCSAMELLLSTSNRAQRPCVTRFPSEKSNPATSSSFSKEKVAEEAAKEIAEKLTAAGATVELK